MWGSFSRLAAASVGTFALAGAAFVGVSAAPAGAAGVSVGGEAAFASAWSTAGTTEIDLASDVTLTCTTGAATRNSTTAIVVNGNGHTLTQTCASDGVLVQQGTGTVTLTDITVTGGDSNDMGGALSTTGNVAITRSTITGNHAESEGGAIHTFGGGTVDVTDSALTGNTSGGSGGAVSSQGLITLTRSSVTGNTSGNNGGGLRSYGGATIINSTVSGNTASSDGGALDGGPVALVYATVVDNTAGGGDNLALDDSALTSFGSVVALPHSNVNCSGVSSTTTNGYNVDDDGTCGFGAGTGDQSNLATSLDLAALADNGGPGPTRLPGASSPLVDQIPTAACGAGLGITTDERGGLRPAGTACDIGAVEAGATLPTTTTTAPPTTVAASGSTTSTTVAPAAAATPVAATPTFTG